MNINDKRRFWKEHLHKAEFPREVGIGFTRREAFARKEVDNLQEYSRIIERNTHNNLYTSVYSFNQWESSKFDKVFFDIDGGINQTHKTMQGIVSHLKNLYGYEGNVYCSGNGGYHIYLYFPEVRVKRYALRSWSDAFINEAAKNRDDVKLQYVDTTVLGDKRRLGRLPYTINHKSGKLCTPINPSWGLREIYDEINRPAGDTHIRTSEINMISSEIKEINETLETEIDEDRRMDWSITDERKKEYRKELRVLMIEARKVKDGRKRMLSFLIIPRLYHLGASLSQTINYARKWLNRTGKSLYQYKNLIESNYQRTKEGNWYAWNYVTFFEEHPELMEEFKDLSDDRHEKHKTEEEVNLHL